MRRRRQSNTEGPGQDSFLDIVANLVGILIILVMVVGVRAKDAMLQAETEREKIAEAEIDIATPTRAAKALVASINDIQSRIEGGMLELRYRKAERDKMLQLIGFAEQALKEETGKLKDSEAAELERLRASDEARQRLERLAQQRDAIEKEAAPSAVLEHIPTPLAKTVFGKEVHFRLENHHIVQVPWDALVDQFKKEAPENYWKLKQAAEFTEVIGPLQGFRLRYTIAKRRYGVSTSAGQVKMTRAELDHFVIIPTRPNAGERVADAMRPGSQFSTALRGLHPDRVTLTIWVYPDSFEDYRVLRESLVRQGYVTAARPMPAGRNIGGAPSGSRSMAQ